MSMDENCQCSTKMGVINIEIDKSTSLSREMTKKESEFYAVGLGMQNIYNLDKGTELFDDKVDVVVIIELSQTDRFEAYKLVNRKDLISGERCLVPKSMMKIAEKSANKYNNRKTKERMVVVCNK